MSRSADTSRSASLREEQSTIDEQRCVRDERGVVRHQEQDCVRTVFRGAGAAHRLRAGKPCTSRLRVFAARDESVRHRGDDVAGDDRVGTDTVLYVLQGNRMGPRLGGGFGNKQEMILEDMCALLTMRTGRPVLMEYTRKQEFTSSRSRHPNVVRVRVGVKDGKVTATEIYTIGDTGAHGTQGLTVQMAGGLRGLTLYNSANARFITDVVYTNKPPAAAFRGYGAMQVQYAVEVLMEEASEALGVDVVDFKRAHWIRKGDSMRMAVALGEGREGFAQNLESGDYGQLMEIGMKVTDYAAKHAAYRKQTGRIRKGIGFSVTMHGSGVAGLDMGAATIKLNDGGFLTLRLAPLIVAPALIPSLPKLPGRVGCSRRRYRGLFFGHRPHTPFDKGLMPAVPPISAVERYARPQCA